jgi:hypothetical protein
MGQAEAAILVAHDESSAMKLAHSAETALRGSSNMSASIETFSTQCIEIALDT